MSSSISPYTSTNTREIFNVSDICENSFFFLQVNKNVNEFYNNVILDKKIPNQEHINILKEEFHNVELEILEDNKEEKLIKILPDFYMAIDGLKEIPKENSLYAKRIKSILIQYSDKKVITLKIIKMKYEIIYKEKISLITISRILRFHLGLHYNKTILKNPKLDENNYLLMGYSFIIGIIKAIESKLNIIFIDETGFEIVNNHLYMWRKKGEQITGGPKKEIKKRINLILAMDKKEIIYGQYYRNTSIGSNEFIDFIKEIISKIGREKIENSLFVMDNASYHLSKKVKSVARKEKLKFLLNVPYKSQFNAIELVFHLIKNNLNKEIYDNNNDFLKRIVNLIDDEKINGDIRKTYIKTIKEYIEFYENYKDKIKDIKINTKFIKKKRKRNTKKSNS